jgi:hypothetical protein
MKLTTITLTFNASTISYGSPQKFDLLVDPLARSRHVCGQHTAADLVCTLPAFYVNSSFAFFYIVLFLPAEYIMYISSEWTILRYVYHTEFLIFFKYRLSSKFVVIIFTLTNIILPSFV